MQPVLYSTHKGLFSARSTPVDLTKVMPFSDKEILVDLSPGTQDT